MKRLFAWVMLVMFNVACSSSDSADTRNSEFERWCGDSPCDWTVEGDVRRVGTWHPNDYGVELLGDDASLIQENAKVNYHDADCLSFVMVAKIPDGVRVFLELDFLADGSVEFSQRLPVSNWERRTFKITTPDWYSKVRFIIRKEGAGRATFAELSSGNANLTCTAPAVELKERPAGALCSGDDECAESLACAAGRCGGCETDATCSAEQVCALRDVDDARFRQCVERATLPLGAACDRRDQCQSGSCAGGACSECVEDQDCGKIQCLPALMRPPNSRFWPQLCAVGSGMRKSGEACSAHVDCESRECRGFSVACDPSWNCTDRELPCFSCSPDIHFGECR